MKVYVLVKENKYSKGILEVKAFDSYVMAWDEMKDDWLNEVGDAINIQFSELNSNKSHVWSDERVINWEIVETEVEELIKKGE